MKTTLQTLRKYAPSIDSGFNTDSRGIKTPIFYASPGAFDGEKFAHEVRRMDHTGWFTNNDGETFKDGSGLCRGVIVEFPARPGFPDGWFIAGYNLNGDSCTYFADVFDSADDAARFADSAAESIADIEREYQEKWAMARELEDKNEQRAARLLECLALRNNPCFARMRCEARELMGKIRETRERLQTEFADYV